MLSALWKPELLRGFEGVAIVKGPPETVQDEVLDQLLLRCVCAELYDLLKDRVNEPLDNREWDCDESGEVCNTSEL